MLPLMQDGGAGALGEVTEITTWRGLIGQGAKVCDTSLLQLQL
jgi:hypothetical protein